MARNGRLSRGENRRPERQACRRHNASFHKILNPAGWFGRRLPAFQCLKNGIKPSLPGLIPCWKNNQTNRFF
jgi:hypothetical protein